MQVPRPRRSWRSAVDRPPVAPPPAQRVRRGPAAAPPGGGPASQPHAGQPAPALRGLRDAAAPGPCAAVPSCPPRQALAAAPQRGRRRGQPARSPRPRSTSAARRRPRPAPARPCRRSRTNRRRAARAAASAAAGSVSEQGAGQRQLRLAPALVQAARAVRPSRLAQRLLALGDHPGGDQHLGPVLVAVALTTGLSASGPRAAASMSASAATRSPSSSGRSRGCARPCALHRAAGRRACRTAASKSAIARSGSPLLEVDAAPVDVGLAAASHRVGESRIAPSKASRASAVRPAAWQQRPLALHDAPGLAELRSVPGRCHRARSASSRSPVSPRRRPGWSRSEPGGRRRRRRAGPLAAARARASRPLLSAVTPRCAAPPR